MPGIATAGKPECRAVQGAGQVRSLPIFTSNNLKQIIKTYDYLVFSALPHRVLIGYVPAHTVTAGFFAAYINWAGTCRAATGKRSLTISTEMASLLNDFAS